MAAALEPQLMRTIDAGGYDVVIGAALRHEYASRLRSIARAHRYAVITDDHVAPLYGLQLAGELGDTATLHTVPAGESHKTRASWARITDELLAAGHGRDSVLVAIGGGVVGDLAGFVGATFMRGIPVVLCPTTLLAMVDASVGGKTGVDTKAGKNLVGAFHPPAAVLADVETLRTLPVEHRRAGLAEAIKHGVIADATHFNELAALLPAILQGETSATMEVVARSVEIKAAVVRADSREHGLRKTLNFGHTLGHAIEHVSGYGLLHGECVAIGMTLEARLAERAGIAERGSADAIEGVLRDAGLPTERPRDLDIDALIAATALDKKARGGSVQYALPSRIGSMAGAETGYGISVADELVREVLA